MGTRPEQAPPLERERETILQQPTNPGSGADSGSPRPAFVAGSGPQLTIETQALLRTRLRAAALMLLIGFGAFLIRHVVGVLTGEPLSAILLGFHVLVVIVLASAGTALAARRLIDQAAPGRRARHLRSARRVFSDAAAPCDPG